VRERESEKERERERKRERERERTRMRMKEGDCEQSPTFTKATLEACFIWRFLVCRTFTNNHVKVSKESPGFLSFQGF
jgi:hypothetical protein